MPLLRPYKITSPFGMRKHPITGIYTLHEGIDINANFENIYSYADGKVLRVSYYKTIGKYIDIQHNGYFTRYQHLSKTLVEVGQTIARKELVGVSGNTGVGTGPHLHFGISKNGKWVNPEMFSPITKTEISINGKKYKGFLDDENVSYVEVRKPFEDLGHNVEWNKGVSVSITDFYNQAIDRLIFLLNTVKNE